MERKNECLAAGFGTPLALGTAQNRFQNSQTARNDWEGCEYIVLTLSLKLGPVFETGSGTSWIASLHAGRGIIGESLRTSASGNDLSDPWTASAISACRIPTQRVQINRERHH
jgi:hypothetical protein